MSTAALIGGRPLYDADSKHFYAMRIATSRLPTVEPMPDGSIRMVSFRLRNVESATDGRMKMATSDSGGSSNSKDKHCYGTPNTCANQIFHVSPGP